MQTHSRSNFAFDMSQTDDFFIVPFVDSIFSSYCFATSTLSTVESLVLFLLSVKTRHYAFMKT